MGSCTTGIPPQLTSAACPSPSRLLGSAQLLNRVLGLGNRTAAPVGGGQTLKACASCSHPERLGTEPVSGLLVLQQAQNAFLKGRGTDLSSLQPLEMGIRAREGDK